MPTKERRERERQRELEARQTQDAQDAMFNNPPAHSRDWPTPNILSSDHAEECPDPICKLKHGLISGDEFGNVFPNKVIGSRSDKANEYREQAAQRATKQLKEKYPEDWNRRGGAKKIAYAENEAGNPVNVDSVRRYIRKDKNRQARKSPRDT